MSSTEACHYRCAAFAALAPSLRSVVGIGIGVVYLPGIFDYPPDYDEEEPNITWMGQGVEVAQALGFLLLVVIYVAKRVITHFAGSVLATVGWYCLSVVCSLPYIWFLVVWDWQNPHIFRHTCWVYYPIAIWAAPRQVLPGIEKAGALGWQLYLLRSFFEVVAVVPAWMVIWVFISFFFLGGGWI